MGWDGRKCERKRQYSAKPGTRREYRDRPGNQLVYRPQSAREQRRPAQPRQQSPRNDGAAVSGGMTARPATYGSLRDPQTRLPRLSTAHQAVLTASGANTV